MTNTLWLGEEAPRRPRFQFCLVEFFSDAVIERAAQHHDIPVIGVRVRLEDRVRRPPDELNIKSGFRTVSHDGCEFLCRADAGNSCPRHLVQFDRRDRQRAPRQNGELLCKARRHEKRRQQNQEREAEHQILPYIEKHGVRLAEAAMKVCSLSHATGVSRRKSGKPRLAAGEGWGERLRSIVELTPLTRIAIAIRPLPMGEVKAQPQPFGASRSANSLSKSGNSTMPS